MAAFSIECAPADSFVRSLHPLQPPRILLLCLALASLAACQCGGAPTKPKLRDLGEVCLADGECVTGLCAKLPDGKDKTCLQKCTAGCGANEICTPLDLNRYACVPEREGICRSCATNAQCPYPGDLCVAVGGARFCGRDCTFDSKCPSGYRCEPGFDLQGNEIGVQCQPVSGTCTCTPSTIGQTVPCEKANSFGVCMGVQTCEQTGFSSCNVRTPTQEICNGADDDCDSSTDENLGQTTCGLGECLRTVDNCVAGVPVSCLPGDAGTEVCNEKDDDCDGTVDDGFNKQISNSNCGTCGTVCTATNGTPACVNGACTVIGCTAPFANCNNVGADGCETNTNTSLQHCGACNAACGGSSAIGTCTAGVCTLQCLPGFVDLDANPANGCEYACTVSSTTDLPDLAFVDANCDGIDGEVNNAIFVSAAGNDANPGSRAQPKATIQAGLNAAAAQNKRDVLVSVGNYPTQITMPSNVGVFGAYAPGTWSRATANIVNVMNVNSPLLIENVGNVTVQLMNFLGTTPAGSSATAYGAVIRLATNVKLEAVQIRAGNGTAGVNGTAGFSGSSGNSGSTGIPGCEDSGGFCSGCSQPTGGFGGSSACGRTGGRGGTAGHGAGYGGAGGVAVGGTSGGAGVPNGWGNAFNLGAPYVGAQGSPGGGGTPGSSAGPVGTLSSFGYVVALASGGFAGLDGNGGGGGGGGGGGESNCDSYGGGGGGGGAGGCGGGGGTRGFSGGASIGVFLDSSTVSATGVSVLTGNGGGGGNGGAGGSPGVGGAGGVASNGSGNEYGGNSEQDDGSNGARGGRGGNGGGGGAGGAGGGGPVFAVVRAGGSTWTADAATTYALGTPGVGGSSAAGAGQGGLSQAVY